MMRTTVSLWICFFISLVVLSVVTPLSGQFAYVTNTSSGDVSGYTINTINGALTPIPGSPFAAGRFPDSLAVDPTGKFAYVSNSGTAENEFLGGVSGYTINATSGALTPLPGSPFAAGTVPTFAAVDPTGKFAYVVDFGATGNLGSTVSGNTSNPTSVALSPFPGSPFATSSFPLSLLVGP